MFRILKHDGTILGEWMTADDDHCESREIKAASIVTLVEELG